MWHCTGIQYVLRDKKIRAWNHFHSQYCFVAKSRWKSHFEISEEAFGALVKWSHEYDDDDLRMIDFVWEMVTGLRMPDETTRQRMELYWKNSSSIQPSENPLREYVPFDYSSVLDIPKVLLKELLKMAKEQGSPSATDALWKFCSDLTIPEVLVHKVRELANVEDIPAATDALWDLCVGMSGLSPNVATGLLDLLPSLLTTERMPPKQYGSHFQEQLSFIRDSKIDETLKRRTADFLRTTSLEAFIYPSTCCDEQQIKAYHSIIQGHGHVHDAYMECLFHLSMLPTCKQDNEDFSKTVVALHNLTIDGHRPISKILNSLICDDVLLFSDIVTLREQYITQFEDDRELMKMVQDLSWRLGNESKFFVKRERDHGFDQNEWIDEDRLTTFWRLNKLAIDVIPVKGNKHYQYSHHYI